MKLEHCIILKLILNFNDFEPQYFNVLYCCENKKCVCYRLTRRGWVLLFWCPVLFNVDAVALIESIAVRKESD